MIAGFLRWWVSELAGLVPGAGRAGAHAGQWLEVDLRGERAQARLGGSRGRPLMDMPRDDAPAIEQALAGVIAGLDPRRVQVRVAVPEQRVLDPP